MYCNPTRNEYLERRFRLTFCRILGKITDANRRGKRIVYVWNASERRRLVKAFAGTHWTGSGALYENTAYICVKDKRENNGRQDVCGVNKGGTAEMLGPLWGRASRRFYIGAYRKWDAFPAEKFWRYPGICRVTGNFYDPGETGKTEETVETVETVEFGRI